MVVLAGAFRGEVDVACLTGPPAGNPLVPDASGGEPVVLWGRGGGVLGYRARCGAASAIGWLGGGRGLGRCGLIPLTTGWAGRVVVRGGAPGVALPGLPEDHGNHDQQRERTHTENPGVAPGRGTSVGPSPGGFLPVLAVPVAGGVGTIRVGVPAGRCHETHYGGSPEHDLSGFPAGFSA